MPHTAAKGPQVPAEWAPQRAIWTAWPHLLDEWSVPLSAVQAELVGLVQALAAGGTGPEIVVLAPPGPQATVARTALGPNATVLEEAYGDIWLRDTGPIFAADGSAATFAFNGWGGKYVMDGDATLAGRIAARRNAPVRAFDFVLEGGGIDGDGEGTFLTTRQCLLNPNRNPGWGEAEAERALGEALGARALIWLDQGLVNDHTDGHIDNIARFVAPGRVVCQSPTGPDDPNAETLSAIAAALAQARDAAGRRLEVILVPSPGLVTDTEGAPVPASHMNFLISNRVVAVPAYNDHAAAAMAALAPLFPDRHVVALPSAALLAGGGSFHCITQQEPAQ